MARPARVLDAIGGADQDDEAVQIVARVLGARLVLQGLTDLAIGPRFRKVDVVLELTHAASMLPAAALWDDHRRTALVSAAVASSIGLLDLGSAHRPMPADTAAGKAGQIDPSLAGREVSQHESVGRLT